MAISIEHLFNKFKDAEVYYPLSNKFMEWCAENHKEQKSGGFYKYVKRDNIVVDYAKHSPNQKWHLLKSYCTYEKDMKGYLKRHLSCPELSIWICEALGLGISKDDITHMEDMIIKGSERRDAGEYLWNKYKLEEEISK